MRPDNDQTPNFALRSPVSALAASPHLTPIGGPFRRCEDVSGDVNFPAVNQYLPQLDLRPQSKPRQARIERSHFGI
jgi:hypothetical protein